MASAVQFFEFAAGQGVGADGQSLSRGVKNSAKCLDTLISGKRRQRGEPVGEPLMLLAEVGKTVVADFDEA